MEEKGVCLGVMPGPDPEQFKRKSKVDSFAARGLGKSDTAVEAFVEMFSSVLYREDMDVPTAELERWLDAYYQLRYEAEREADTAKFVADGCKPKGRLEPIVPKVSKGAEKDDCFGWPGYIAAARNQGRWPELTTLLAILGLFSLPFGPKFCGPEVKDAEETEAKDHKN